MYECLIEKYKDDVKYYEYYMNEHGAIPKTPHVKIPEGAEYLICHEKVYDKELVFNKNNFDYTWSITHNYTKWENSNWDSIIGDRFEYMKEHYGSVVLWKREEELKPMKDFYPDDVLAVTESKSTKLWWYDNGMVSKPNDNLYQPWHSTYKQYLTDVPYTKLIYKREDKVMEITPVNEDIYLLTKLQACDVLLSRTSVLQYQSTDGDWVDFKSNANKSNAQLYVILFNLDDTKFRIKPELDHIPIEFCEVMDMLTDNRGNEIFINKEANLAQAENPLFYLQYHYHDKYSRVVEKQVTYDQWKTKGNK
jgi:hypothetical protein